MNIRFAIMSINGTCGTNGSNLKHLKNRSFSAGTRAVNNNVTDVSDASVTFPGTDSIHRGAYLPSQTANLDLLDFLDPLSRPITGSSELYGDGGGI